MTRVHLRSSVVVDRLVRAGMSQRGLASSIGLSGPALSLILSGKRGTGPKSRKALMSCALFADLSFDDLFIIEGDQQAA
jgi:predicted transcriptional regulator